MKNAKERKEHKEANAGVFQHITYNSPMQYSRFVDQMDNNGGSCDMPQWELSC